MADKNTAAKKPGLGDYFKGIKLEMKKVVWPTKHETVSYTGVVIFTCAVSALGIWVLDSAFLAALKGILNITF